MKISTILEIAAAAAKSPSTWASIGAFLGALYQAFPHAQALGEAAAGVTAAAARGDVQGAAILTGTAILTGASAVSHAIKDNKIKNGARSDN